MALVTVQDLKEYLKVPPGQTVEDGLIGRLRAAAIALIEAYLGRPLNGADRTIATQSGWPAVRSFRGSNDAGGVTTGVATVPALDQEPEYSARIEPQLNQDITDTVAHFYQQRNPSASAESEGGGISTSWDEVGDSGLPKRVERRLKMLRDTLTPAA